MNTDKTPGYRRIALGFGMAMALGPLTAMSVASLYQEDSANVIAGTDASTLEGYDSTRYVASEYQGKRLADVAASAGSLDFFSSVLDAAQVKDLLRGPEQYTVFIPVNEAFLDIGGEQLASILNDTTEVERLAKAHVVPGRVTATELMAETQMRSINGHEISSRVGAELRVNGASIIGSEVAENGIVHYVDRLL